MKLTETMIKIIPKAKCLGKSILEAPRICVLRNLLEVHMYFNEYNKVKTNTITAGYNGGVTNTIMMKSLRDQSNQWD